MKNKIFEQRKLLKAYDHILPLAAYYQRIIAIHLQALEKCEKVIDLGCGSGNLTLEYLKQGKNGNCCRPCFRITTTSTKKSRRVRRSSNCRAI